MIRNEVFTGAKDIQVFKEDCNVSDIFSGKGLIDSQGEGRFIGQWAGTINKPATSQSRSMLPSILLLEPANVPLSKPVPVLFGQA